MPVGYFSESFFSLVIQGYIVLICAVAVVIESDFMQLEEMSPKLPHTIRRTFWGYYHLTHNKEVMHLLPDWQLSLSALGGSYLQLNFSN